MHTSISRTESRTTSALLALPAEVRIAILEYVFDDNLRKSGLSLQALLACRQMYQDGSIVAFSKTSFIMSSLFGNIPERLLVLHTKQVEAIRNISFVADARQFRGLINWSRYPFSMPNVRLDKLTIILHPSSSWHYLFDFTSGVVELLRDLHNVRRIFIIRNNARVKGSFKTWYNRLVGMIMKVDHHERYEKSPRNPEKMWWWWSYDEVAQSLCLEARPPKPMMDEESYMLMMQPLLEEWKVSVENEEWNPDPRSRMMYY
ncbi:hypothetical protein LTR37_002117 [Vermiconidia calcicola]|uniref:Uncharacterized protein n=1 Tax=Vermiconidia calcicola TaxID=1690605 RepID=A0ACC3NWH8_9PEZI|nr:hypothetical protein LTR37_002117 [Vermiconidia calcicola]